MDQTSDDSGLCEILAHAPGNPVIWDRFLSCLTRLTACESSYILATNFIQRENTHFLFSFNLTEQQKNLSISELNKVNAFNFLLAKNPNQVFCSQVSSLLEQKAAINTSCFGFSISFNAHHTINLCINRRKSFSEKEQHHIRLLLLSLVKPLESAIKVDLEHKIYSQAVHHTHDHFDSYVIVDHSLNILFSDSVYTSVIDKVDCLNINNNRIEFNKEDIHQNLMHLMSKNETAFIHNRCDSWLLTLIPVSSLDNLYDWECFNDGFILAFTEDIKKNPVVDRLISVHHLSRSEAYCAVDFMQVPSIAEIAKNSCRSEDTVRNHIKHIMQKMKVHNQAALMKKLITLSVL